MSRESREELEARLAGYVGRTTGPPQLAPDAVNEAMIRHWCDAMGDSNPVYTDTAAAAASVHGQLVAPPTMMQAWVLRGIEMADPEAGTPNEQTNLHGLLTDNGYPSVVATNCEQGYTRYLAPGDRVSVTTTIEAVSEQKATALGIGYFIDTREVYTDQKGEEVGWMTFRVLKFQAHEQPAVAEEKASGEAAKPTRMAAPRGRDNGWWWEGVDRGQLLLQRCTGCQTLRHPPRPMCGQCRSLEWEETVSTGKGTVYSYVVLHYPKFPGYEYPIVCALVDLEEGVRMMSNVTGCEPGQVAIGMTVEASVEMVDAATKLPVFRPA